MKLEAHCACAAPQLLQRVCGGCGTSIENEAGYLDKSPCCGTSIEDEVNSDETGRECAQCNGIGNESDMDHCNHCYGQFHKSCMQHPKGDFYWCAVCCVDYTDVAAAASSPPSSRNAEQSSMMSNTEDEMLSAEQESTRFPGFDQVLLDLERCRMRLEEESQRSVKWQAEQMLRCVDSMPPSKPS